MSQTKKEDQVLDVLNAYVKTFEEALEAFRSVKPDVNESKLLELMQKDSKLKDLVLNEMKIEGKLEAYKEMRTLVRGMFYPEPYVVVDNTTDK
ncbi:hypothetical protein ACWGPW_24450 [Paenibacillus chitinolyticus]